MHHQNLNDLEMSAKEKPETKRKHRKSKGHHQTFLSSGESDNDGDFISFGNVGDQDMISECQDSSASESDEEKDLIIDNTSEVDIQVEPPIQSPNSKLQSTEVEIQVPKVKEAEVLSKQLIN